jgi:hypothetical protein
MKTSGAFHISGLAKPDNLAVQNNRQSEVPDKTLRRIVRVGQKSAEGKKTKQMPKARKDKMSYERHNRIVHLLKTECSFPAASQLPCMPPYSRSHVSHLRVRRMPTDMPAISCAG